MGTANEQLRNKRLENKTKIKTRHADKSETISETFDRNYDKPKRTVCNKIKKNLLKSDFLLFAANTYFKSD